MTSYESGCHFERGIFRSCLSWMVPACLLTVLAAEAQELHSVARTVWVDNYGVVSVSLRSTGSTHFIALKSGMDYAFYQPLCFKKGTYYTLVMEECHVHWKESSWEDVCEPGQTGVDLNSEDEIVEEAATWDGGKKLADRVMVLVDSHGVFKHHVAWCGCSGAADQPMQLFQAKLFPSSWIRMETAFTFDVLDHFYIDGLECKTAALSFFQKLR